MALVPALPVNLQASELDLRYLAGFKDLDMYDERWLHEQLAKVKESGRLDTLTVGGWYAVSGTMKYLMEEHAEAGDLYRLDRTVNLNQAMLRERYDPAAVDYLVQHGHHVVWNEGAYAFLDAGRYVLQGTFQQRPLNAVCPIALTAIGFDISAALATLAEAPYASLALGAGGIVLGIIALAVC